MILTMMNLLLLYKKMQLKFSLNEPLVRLTRKHELNNLIRLIKSL